MMTSRFEGERPSGDPPRNAGAGPAGPPLRLVYVLGTGRCGSTLLDVILGAHPDIQSTGELFAFPKFVPTIGYPCSCGQTATRCSFWSEVIREYTRQADLMDLHRGWQRFERIRDLPATIVSAVSGRRSFREHVTRLAHFYQAIATTGGRPIVVDSSKDPARGYVCSFLRPSEVDVRFVHLVRDGRGFLWSKQSTPDGNSLRGRREARPRWALVAQWLIVNLLASLVGSGRSRRCLRIRYEDLAADPVGTLARLGTFLGVDLSGVTADLELHHPIPLQHVIGGNRLRFAGPIVLQPDNAWERLLPAQDERAFWRWAGWLAHVYGYARGVRRANPLPAPPSRVAG